MRNILLILVVILAATSALSAYYSSDFKELAETIRCACPAGQLQDGDLQ